MSVSGRGGRSGRDPRLTRRASKLDTGGLEAHTVAALKEMLRERGLRVSGSKAVLVERLQAAVEAGQAPPALEASGQPEAVSGAGTSSLAGKTAAELKALLRAKGLKVSGTKPQLIERLESSSGAGQTTPPQPSSGEFVIGQKLAGTVRNITSFGAFVDVGADRDGLVPLAKMAEGAVRSAEDVVSLGAAVDVWVSNVRADGAVELSMVEQKARLRTPSERTPAGELHVGQTLQGCVRNIAGVGAFVDIGTARDGLIRNTKIAGLGPATESLSVGQEVYVRVVNRRPDGAMELQQLSEEMFLKLRELPRVSGEGLRLGQELTGVVTFIVSYGVFVDVGAERDALVPRSKLSEDKVADIRDVVNEGDEVRVWVSSIRDVMTMELTMVESTVRAADSSPLFRVSDLEIGQKLVGYVTDIVDYGAFVDINADRKGLVPSSKMTEDDDVDGADVVDVGQEVVVWVSRVRRNGDLELTMVEDKTFALVNELEVGQRFEGPVIRIADYGVFVDIGKGRYGLVPIASLAEEQIENVEDLLELGKTVEVWVSRVRKRGVFELSLVENPILTKAPRDLSGFVGADPQEWHTGTVSAVHDFGVFVMLKPPGGGPEEGGLVHVSQLSSEYVDSVPDLVQVGQEVSVRVARVDLEAGRMELSMVP